MQQTIEETLEGLLPGARLLNEIRTKNGVHVWRAAKNGESLVVKYFEDEGSAREIGNYALLQQLSIPTLRVIAAGERCLCLEDIGSDSTLRMGRSEDMNDPVIARRLAVWYRALHDRSAGSEKLRGLYRESDSITPETLLQLQEQYPAPVWEYLLQNYAAIDQVVHSVQETLSYNDFFWTNLVVAQDKSRAMMFDYNLLGRSYRYSDIRNVCWSLSPEAGHAFRKAYGDWDVREASVDRCLSAIVTLIHCSTRSAFPHWGQQALAEVRQESYLLCWKQLIG